MLVQYDRAMKALSTALNSKEVSVVLQSRNDLELIKLRAKQLRDRALLADATEFTMRVERWLGVLLAGVKQAGQIADGRPGKGEKFDPSRVRLRDIGIDKKLSSKAQRAALLKDTAFEAAILEMRSSISGSGAKLINLARGAERKSRRRPSSVESCFGFLLESGTPLGRLKLGTLRSRIERLAVELNILNLILEQTGSGATDNAMASVEESISEAVLDRILRTALESKAASAA